MSGKRKGKAAEPKEMEVLNLPTSVDEAFKLLHSKKAASIAEVTASGLFHYIPAGRRGDFMDEAFRILKPGGKLSIIVPYWTGMRAYADFAVQWPPIAEMSFMLFNREWRTANHIHPQLKCDFDFTYGYSCDPETNTRSSEVQSDWIKHKLNTALDLHVNLVKR